jgi:short-subunit dehydrogenase
MKLEGKRIVLTGAASGIGAALLEALARYDARVLAADRDAARLQTTIAGLKSPRAHLLPFVGDVGTAAGVDTLFAHAVDALGGLDVFIANAGFAYYEPFAGADWEHIEAIYRVNTFSPLYALAKLRALRGGQPYHMVIMASAMARLPLAGYALYGSTKAALDSFAQAYRYEAQPNERLTVVYPIATRSNFFRAAGQSVPVPFPSQTPEQVAHAVISGIERDRRVVYPSRLFAAGEALARVLPLAGRIYQEQQARIFRGWLRRKAGA